MPLKPPKLTNDCFALPRGVTWIPVDEALNRLKKSLHRITEIEKMVKSNKYIKFSNNDSKEALSILKEKPALIVSFLNGKEKTVSDSKSCYLVGEYLAKLHLTASNFSKTNKNSRDLDWMSKMYLNLKNHLSLEDQKIIELEINYHKEFKKDELPEGIIHGDLFQDNVLFFNDKISGFIDFYYACNEKFIYD